MGFHCRKLLHQHQHEKTILYSPAPSPSPLQPPLSLSLPLPMPSFPIHDEGFHTHTLHVAMIVMACTVGFVMLLCIVSIIRRNYYSRRHDHNHNHMRGRNTPILFYVNGDSPVSGSDDDDDGPIIEHPIWFIRTVGLQQSVIDSITVFTYRKDERLIDGTECSVCLGEFQEDESLRLLPKCSHAFHIPCIDTWLRSHKNCPLCRASVVHDAAGGTGSGNTEVRATEPDSIVSGENQETTRIENFDGGLGNYHVGESEGGVLRIGDDDACVLLSSEDGGGSGQTPDNVLANFDKVNCHASISHEVEEEIQPMRRSVSMDSCTASIMFRDAVDLNSDQEGSETQLGDKINSCSKDVTSAKQGSGSSSSTICKLASIGRALQKRPISLRSSFSHNRKSLSSRHCRSHSSTLPL